MENPKQILLISYTFPPYPGIGGRRWAKFAKYLAKQGYIVNVICAKNPFRETSLWQDDVQHENIRICELDSNYPTILLKQPKTICEKINYRLSLFYVNLFTKGTPYDRGIFWEKELIKTSGELIKKYDIKNVIVSCAPFSSAYQSLKLKKEFSAINLIVDFRDPWTWGKAYGFSGLDQKRLEYEKMMQNSVIEKADKIFVPVDVMRDHLKSSYEIHSDKIFTLPHGFDKDEIQTKRVVSGNKIKIIFYGSLYDGIKEYFTVISKIIRDSNSNITLDIYSDSMRYSDLFEKDNLLNKQVFYYKSIPTNELFLKISSANYVLVVHPDYGVNNISTKFFEIIYSRVPILYVSKSGITSKFIESNRIGYFLELHNIEQNLKNIFDGSVPYNYENNYNVDHFSFENITKNLILNYLN